MDMVILITTFINPFSFFCFIDDSKGHDALLFKNETKVNIVENTVITNEFHGQYVAVMWNNKWVRGVVSLESQFLIWLIDYGIYIQPSEKHIYKDLPIEYRNLPTKIFEASIHGVVPVDKSWTWLEGDSFENSISTTWTPGSIEAAQTLIKNSMKTNFKPVALLTTQNNYVLLGDLFLEIQENILVNVVDELKTWPVFLEVNPQAYVQNLVNYYKSHRHLRSCLLKPDISRYNMPSITLQISLEEYLSLVAKSPAIETYFENENILDGSTVVSECKKDISTSNITPEDIEKYSKCYITFNCREYNVLTILVNKTHDLNICEKYKDHDLKYIGRGTSYKSRNFEAFFLHFVIIYFNKTFLQQMQ